MYKIFSFCKKRYLKCFKAHNYTFFRLYNDKSEIKDISSQDLNKSNSHSLSKSIIILNNIKNKPKTNFISQLNEDENKIRKNENIIYNILKLNKININKIIIKQKKIRDNMNNNLLNNKKSKIRKKKFELKLRKKFLSYRERKINIEKNKFFNDKDKKSYKRITQKDKNKNRFSPNNLSVNKNNKNSIIYLFGILFILIFIIFFIKNNI